MTCIAQNTAHQTAHTIKGNLRWHVAVAGIVGNTMELERTKLILQASLPILLPFSYLKFINSTLM